MSPDNLLQSIPVRREVGTDKERLSSCRLSCCNVVAVSNCEDCHKFVCKELKVLFLS